MLDRAVLVLNQNYEPLNVCSVRRALALMFRGKASNVETGLGVVRSVAACFDVPSVVRLERYIRAPRRRLLIRSPALRTCPRPNRRQVEGFEAQSQCR